MKTYKIITLFVVIFSVISCSVPLNEIDATFTPASPSPTQPTPPPTTLPTPTATPTPKTPVLLGTPYPDSELPINQENIKNIKEVAVFQNGHQVARMADDLTRVFIADLSGVTVCRMETIEVEGVFEDEKKILPCTEIIDHFDVIIRTNESGGHNSSDFLITPDGNKFLAVTDTHAIVMNIKGETLGSIPYPTGEFTSAISPDGKYVSFLVDKKVAIYNTESGLEVFKDNALTAHFSPDGKFYGTQKAQGIVIYSISDWSIAYQFSQDLKSGWGFTGDAQLIANVDKGDLFFRRMNDGEVERVVRRFKEGDVVLSPKGNFALKVNITPSMMSPYEAQIEVWDTLSGQIVLSDQAGWYSDVSQWLGFSEVIDLSHLKITDQGIAYHLGFEKPWKNANDNQKFYITESSEVIIEVAIQKNTYFHPDEVCIISNYSTISCRESWFVDNFFVNPAGEIYIKKSSYIPPDDSNPGEYSVISEISKSHINLDIKKEYDLFIKDDPFLINDEIHLHKYSGKPIINEEYKVLLSSYKSELRVLDMATGEIIDNWMGYLEYPELSHDSRFLTYLHQPYFFTDPKRLGVYDFENQELTLFDDENRAGSFALYHHENKMIEIVNEITSNGVDKIVFYDLEDEEKSQNPLIDFPFRDFEEMGRLNCVAISPTDDLILAGTEKGYLIAFDPQTNSMIYQWQAYDDSTVQAIDFSRDGTSIFSASQNGKIKIWATSPFQWKSQE